METLLSVTGTIESPDGNGFIAVFMLDGIKYTGFGSFQPTVLPFNASDVTLTYSTITDLSGSVPFTGVVGMTKISLIVIPNPEVHTSISGPLDNPISQANRVFGDMSWKGN
jgi:hypothetical protein